MSASAPSLFLNINQLFVCTLLCCTQDHLYDWALMCVFEAVESWCRVGVLTPVEVLWQQGEVLFSSVVTGCCAHAGGGERGCVNIHTHTHTVRGSPAEWHERAISRASVCVYQLSLSVLPAPMHLQPCFFSLIHTSLLFLSLSFALFHNLIFSHYYNKRWEYF